MTTGSMSSHLGPLTSNLHGQCQESWCHLWLGTEVWHRSSCYFQLRNIAKLKSILSLNDMKTVSTALISSRVDYCNSLYLDVGQSSLSRLQLVQNAAARLLTGTRKRDSITPALASLQCQIHDWFQGSSVFKAIHGLASLYTSELLWPYFTSRPLRSSEQLFLTVPRSRLVGKGDCAFAVAAPKLCNSLPLSIKCPPSIDTFKTKLKTYVFNGLWFLLVVLVF